MSKTFGMFPADLEVYLEWNWELLSGNTDLTLKMEALILLIMTSWTPATSVELLCLKTSEPEVLLE